MDNKDVVIEPRPLFWSDVQPIIEALADRLQAAELKIEELEEKVDGFNGLQYQINHIVNPDD